MDAGCQRPAAGQIGEAGPAPIQVTAYRIAHVYLIEWADLYADMLAEKRHNLTLHLERAG